MSIEVIKHAVVKSIDGQMFIGKQHADCFYKAAGVGIEMSSKAKDQGFITNKGRYVDREEAAKIAVNAGQLSSCIILCSEDLWSKRHGGKYDYCEIHGYYLRGEK